MNVRLCRSCRKPLGGGNVCPHCGHQDTTLSQSTPVVAAIPVRAQPAESAAARLGQYRVVREIGRGGMGRVLEAVDEPLGRRVAVKVLLLPGNEKDPQRQRFLEEARIAGGLEHPGIVPVYNLGRAADGSAFFSMKLVAGRNLNDILADRERGDRATLQEFSLSRLLSLFERVVETVAYAHAHGVLHRDLKPANIMVGAHGEVWVLDWGLAKAVGDTRPDVVSVPSQIVPRSASGGADLTVPGAVVGTPQYMAPEQALGHSLDVRTDVFGLGGILYKMLTGKSPHDGPDYMGTLMNAAMGQAVPVRSTTAGRRAPAALAAIADKCLATKPEGRYETATDLLADLRAYAAGEAVKARPDGFAGLMFRVLRRHYRAAIVFGTAAALLLIGSTLAATLLAAKDRQALAAERQAQAAEQARQAAIAESAARAERRMRAFTPYAEATDLLMRGQLHDRAAQLLEEALKIDPDFPEAQFALGEALRQAGLPRRAAQAYLRANELSRQITGKPHVQALLAAGMAFDGAGDYKNSEQAFLQAEREGAGHPLALVGKAFRLAEGRRVREARPAAEEAVRIAPHLWETQFALAYVLEEQVNLGVAPVEPTRGQAQALLRKSLELSPRQAETWVWLGHSLQRANAANAREEAIRAFDRAVALEPRNGNRYISRGHYHLDTGNVAAAVADFQKARELDAARPLMLYADAAVAAARGDIETAYRLASNVVREKQDYPQHLTYWIQLGLRLGRDGEIRGRFDEWYRDNPEYPEVYVLKALLKARAKDFAGAVAEDRAGLKVAPYHLRLRHQLATHLIQGGKAQEALPAANAVLELSPGDFTAQMIRARCFAELGRGEEAKTALDQLQKDFPMRGREVEDMRKALSAKLPK